MFKEDLNMFKEDKCLNMFKVKYLRLLDNNLKCLDKPLLFSNNKSNNNLRVKFKMLLMILKINSSEQGKIRFSAEESLFYILYFFY